jgi:site-specific DNA-methyltransferase (adenine-specific)
MTELVLGDCLEALRTLPDHSVDMLLTDLPYGTTRNKWDVVLPFDAFWAQVNRVCKPSAVKVLFASGMFTARLMQSNERHWRYNLVWHKNKTTGFFNAKRMPMRAHEDICVFYDDVPTYHPQMTRDHAPMHKMRRKSNGANYGSSKFLPDSNAGSTERYPGSVLEFPVVNNDDPDRVHPTQKPVALLEWLIRTYTDEGQLVLDPCAGSASTALAAHLCGRRSHCIEREPTYHDASQRRLIRHGVLSAAATAAIQPAETDTDADRILE